MTDNTELKDIPENPGVFLNVHISYSHTSRFYIKPNTVPKSIFTEFLDIIKKLGGETINRIRCNKTYGFGWKGSGNTLNSHILEYIHRMSNTYIGESKFDNVLKLIKLSRDTIQTLDTTTKTLYINVSINDEHYSPHSDLCESMENYVNTIIVGETKSGKFYMYVRGQEGYPDVIVKVDLDKSGAEVAYDMHHMSLEDDHPDKIEKFVDGYTLIGPSLEDIYK